MTKFLLPVLLCICIGANAQVTITQNDMPHAGDELYRTEANIPLFLNYAATGPNHTWNFTNLTAAAQDSAIYQTVASTNPIFAITFADIFLNPNRANTAKQGVDIAIANFLPLTNPFTFNYRTSSVYKTVGLGVDLGGIPLPVIYTNHDRIYSLPLNFGDTDADHSSYNITIPSLVYYGYEQDRTNNVDGWGVINTPAGSFDALRVKTVINGRDSINLIGQGFGLAINRPVAKEYKWLSPGFRTPIMQVNTTSLFGIEVITEVFFYDVQRTLAVDQPLASTLCAGETFNLNYAVTGVFNPGGIFSSSNVFNAQLSDASGSFANAVNIGSVTATVSGVISCTIPANTPAGTGYRIRVVATNPVFTGTDNGFDITIGSLPTAAISAGGPTTFCAGGSVLLSAQTDPSYTYQWQLDGNDITGETGVDYTASSAGNFTVVVTNVCGNAPSAPVTVTVNALPEHTFNAPSFGICNNNPVVITAQNISGQSLLTYQWYLDGSIMPGETQSMVTATIPGNYTLEILNPSTGCTYSASVTAVADSVAEPVINANGNLTFCNGDSVLLSVLQVAGATYQWSLDGNAIAGATGFDYTAMQAGAYTVVVTSATGCTAQSGTAVSVVLSASPIVPVIASSGSPSFCLGGSTTLSITPEPGVTYQWSLNGASISGGTGNSISVSDSGTYTVEAVNAIGCTSVSQPFNIQVFDLPQAPVITATGATTFCDGDSVLLSVIAVLGYNYQWTMNGINIPGAVFNQYTVTGPTGSYSITATDMNGCSSAATLSYIVTVNPLPAAPVITQSNDTLYANPSTGSFQWFLDGVAIPGATNAFWIPVVNGNYSVAFADSNGCASESQVFPVVNVGFFDSSIINASLFPNPTSGLVQVHMEIETGNKALCMVTDISGRIIFNWETEHTDFTFDLGELPAGMYFMRIEAEGKMTAYKVIKE